MDYLKEAAKAPEGTGGNSKTCAKSGVYHRSQTTVSQPDMGARVQEAGFNRDMLKGDAALPRDG